MRALTPIVVVALALPVAAAGGGQPGERAKPQPGDALSLTATAYCHDGTTKSGAHTRSGIAAADPRVLPVGSVVRILGPAKRYAGIYTVMDTGEAVKGRRIDLFIADCGRAEQFGRRTVRVRILRRGWSPRASAPVTEP